MQHRACACDCYAILGGQRSIRDLENFEEAPAHAINTRPFFLPRGAGSEAKLDLTVKQAHLGGL